MRFRFTCLLVLTLFCRGTNASEIESLFAQDRQDPGCAVGVSRNGKIEYLKGFGTANLEHNIPIGPETRFHIASISKEFTAAAIGILLLEDKISLDDDVRIYLPEFPKFDQVVTIRHLLQHSSGLANHTILMRREALDYGNSYTPDEILKIVYAEGLSFKPGSKYQYGANYLVLGRVVERVSGMPLRLFLKQRIFDPLGMKESGLHDDSSLVPNRAEGYLRDGDRWINDRVRYTLTGSGGVHMTIGDLLLWNHALRNDGLRDGLTEIIFDSSPMPVMENLAYHFGFFRSKYRGARASAHSGSYQGTKSLLFAFEPGFATAIACNHKTDVQKLTWALIDIVASLDN